MQKDFQMDSDKPSLNSVIICDEEKIQRQNRKKTPNHNGNTQLNIGSMMSQYNADHDINFIEESFPT